MDAEVGRLVIASLLDVFARKKPVALLEQLVARDLVCHMDGMRLNVGREGLRAWFQYMHATMRRRRLLVDVDARRIDKSGSRRYNVSGTVATRQQKGSVDSRRFVVTYLVEQGRVVGVWSTRSNYVGVVGRSILLPMYSGYLYHCLRAWWYRRVALRKG